MRRLAMVLTALVSLTVTVATPAAGAVPEPWDRWLFEPCGIVSACVVYDGQSVCDEAGQVTAYQPSDEHVRRCAEPDGGQAVMVRWGCPADTLRQAAGPSAGTDSTCSIAWYFTSAGQEWTPSGKG